MKLHEILKHKPQEVAMLSTETTEDMRLTLKGSNLEET
jgi:hypothetical protein